MKFVAYDLGRFHLKWYRLNPAWCSPGGRFRPHVSGLGWELWLGPTPFDFWSPSICHPIKSADRPPSRRQSSPDPEAYQTQKAFSVGILWSWSHLWSPFSSVFSWIFWTSFWFHYPIFLWAGFLGWAFQLDFCHFLKTQINLVGRGSGSRSWCQILGFMVCGTRASRPWLGRLGLDLASVTWTRCPKTWPALWLFGYAFWWPRIWQWFCLYWVGSVLKISFLRELDLSYNFISKKLSEISENWN